jgi:vacuolar-type H+-ATPase subunit F/Vma7
MTTQTAQLVVVAPPELAPGFRLAGATAREAATPEQAEAAVRDLIAEGERGVVAVYEPYFTRFPGEVRDRLVASVAPVVVALPSGLTVEGDASRKARLADLLRQAVGYHITFGEDQK